MEQGAGDSDHRGIGILPVQGGGARSMEWEHPFDRFDELTGAKAQVGSRELGAWSRERGAGSGVTAWSMERGAGSRHGIWSVLDIPCAKK